MRRYLLDTNVLLHVANRAQGHEKILQKISTLQKETVLISVITVWEIARMVEKAKAARIAIDSMLEAMSAFDALPMDEQAAAIAGKLHATLAKQGKTIGERDSMIAGIALANDCVMVTDNTREFVRIATLAVENWRL